MLIVTEQWWLMTMIIFANTTSSPGECPGETAREFFAASLRYGFGFLPLRNNWLVVSTEPSGHGSSNGRWWKKTAHGISAWWFQALWLFWLIKQLFVNTWENKKYLKPPTTLAQRCTMNQWNGNICPCLTIQCEAYWQFLLMMIAVPFPSIKNELYSRRLT